MMVRLIAAIPKRLLDFVAACGLGYCFGWASSHCWWVACG